MADGINYKVTADTSGYTSPMKEAVDSVKDLNAVSKTVEVSKPGAGAEKSLKSVGEAAAEAVREVKELYAKMRAEDAAAAAAVVANWNRNGTNPYAQGRGSAPAEAVATPVITGFGGMLEVGRKESTELSKAIAKVSSVSEDMSEKVDEAADSVKKLGAESAPTSDQLDKVLNIQRAQVAGQIAASLANVGNTIKSTGAKFAESDPEFKKTLDGIADGVNIASAAMQGAANGFALAGPPGAIAGAAIAGGAALATNALDDMTTAMANADAAAQRATVMQERYAAALRERIAEQANAANEAARLENDAVQENSRRQEEAMDSARRNAQSAAATEERIAKKSQSDIARAQEAVYAARLSEEENLQRKIAELQNRLVPPSAAEVNSLPENSPQRAAAAQRLAELVTLQKQLADLKAAEAEKASNAAEQAQREAEAAERKAAAEAKTARAREQAAATSALEEQILQAHASGNDKLEKSLLRQLQVEETKQRLMSQQGLSEPVAAAAAERRVALEEAAAKRDENPGRIRLRNAEESKAAREDRMSAADKARKARWEATDSAIAAASKFVGPPDPRKDHSGAMAKKMDKLDIITKQLADLGLAK